MAEELKVAKVKVFHEGCWGSHTTEKFPEVRVRILSPVTFLRFRGKAADYSALWEVSAPNTRELEDYLGWLRGLKDVLHFGLLQKGRLRAVVLLTTRSPGSTFGTVLRHHATFAEPVELEKGYEIHTVVAPNPNDLKKLLEEFEGFGEVKVQKIGTPVIRKEAYGLTDKQMQALGTAMRNGYYSWPRKATLEELARTIGLKRRAFQENLRKAEAKVFPEMVGELLTKPILLKRK